MGDHDFPADRQAQAGTAGRGLGQTALHEFVEHLFKLILGNPDAAVAYLQQQRALRRTGADGFVMGLCGVKQSPADMTAGRRELDRIGEQVAHHLPAAKALARVVDQRERMGDRCGIKRAHQARQLTAVAQKDQGRPQIDAECASEGVAAAVLDLEVPYARVAGQAGGQCGLCGAAVAAAGAAELKQGRPEQSIDRIARWLDCGIFMVHGAGTPEVVR